MGGSANPENKKCLAKTVTHHMVLLITKSLLLLYIPQCIYIYVYLMIHMLSSINFQKVVVIKDAPWEKCPEDEAEQLRHLARKMVTTAGTLGVPLEVDIK
jgi:hypothetical protein